MTNDTQDESGTTGAPAPTAAGTASSGPEASPGPSFLRRVIHVFVAPARLGAALRDHPTWGAALISGAVLVILQTALIPADVWEAMMRQAAVQRGAPLPTGFSMAGIVRISSIVGSGIGYLIMVPIMAGVVALIFAFILGDEGRYKQYFALMTHASLLPAFFGLLTVPLKIAEKDPKAALNLGTFFFFLPQGYWLRVLTMVDLTQLWAWLVVAAGVHAINPKRSTSSAAFTLIGLNVAVVMVIAIFVHTV